MGPKPDEKAEPHDPSPAGKTTHSSRPGANPADNTDLEKNNCLQAPWRLTGAKIEILLRNGPRETWPKVAKTIRRPRQGNGLSYARAKSSISGAASNDEKGAPT